MTTMLKIILFVKYWKYYIKFIKKNGCGCHYVLLIYDAPKLSTVYVVKLPSQGFFSEMFEFSKNLEFFKILAVNYLLYYWATFFDKLPSG